MYNTNGKRKYLTESETMDFVRLAKQKNKDVYAFCWMLAETGCRISEALSVNSQSIDFQSGTLIIKCLKKRGKSVYREVPLSEEFLRFMKKWINSKSSSESDLWTWSRMTAYRRVCEVMVEAGLTGDYATPRGLRHGFGVRAIQSGVPLNLVQRWLGHADMKTTAIYASASGPEERQIAARMWLDGKGGAGAVPGAERARRENKTESDEWLESKDSVKNVSDERRATGARTDAAEPPPWTLRSAARLIYCHLLRYWLFCNANFHCFSWTYLASREVSRLRSLLSRTAVFRPFGLIADPVPSDLKLCNRTIVADQHSGRRVGSG
ncbi:tyrosine-type recombinase/integrase [Sphingosinicella microcystinivorans]|nr:site-specific integrase [Sphingosinicella microcystinivorans]